MKNAALIPVVTLALLLGGCTSTPPVEPPPAELLPLGTSGVYDLDFGQFTGVYTLLENGEFYGLHFVGEGLAGHPHGTLGAGNTRDTPEPIAWANFIDDAKKVGAQEAAGTLGRSFDEKGLVVAISGSMGDFAARATEQKRWMPNTTASIFGTPLDSLAGDYTGYLRTAGIDQPMSDVDVAIDDDGAFEVTASGCDFAGMLTQHASTGVFDAVVTTAGTSCAFTAQLSGIAVPLAVDGSAVRLAIQLDTDDDAQSAVFIVDGIVSQA